MKKQLNNKSNQVIHTEVNGNTQGRSCACQFFESANLMKHYLKLQVITIFNKFVSIFMILMNCLN